MFRRLIICATAALALAGCHKSLPDQGDKAKAFLAQNAKQPGVRVLPDGLQLRVVRSGPADGLRPQVGDEVKVNYEGKLLDGQVFDSSYERGAPAVMTIRDLVPGWREALQLMRPGDQWLIYLPPKLGYGDQGAGPIPPNSVLVFKLELIGVAPDASSVGRA